MSIWIIVIGISLAIILVIVLGKLDRRYRFTDIRMRRDRKGLWQSAFSKEEFEKADKMLILICDAFLIPIKYKFRLKPSDRLATLYERSTRNSNVDTMEYEHLSLTIKTEFRLDPDEYLLEQSLSVGDLVRVVAKPKTGKAPNKRLQGIGVTAGP